MLNVCSQFFLQDDSLIAASFLSAHLLSRFLSRFTIIYRLQTVISGTSFQHDSYHLQHNWHLHQLYFLFRCGHLTHTTSFNS